MRMRIVDVEALYLRLPQIAARSDSSQDALLIRITTDCGLVGWGEVDSSPWVAKAIIEAPPSHKWASGLRHQLLGEDPLDTERLWRKMYAGTLYFGREGAAIQAMAGIDIALWDIKGKALGQPIWKLLGGRYRDRVRAYASSLFRATPEATANQARLALDQGYSAVKFGWEPFGADLRSDLAYLKAIRRAIGDSVDLILDVGFRWDARTTLQRDEAFRSFNLLWIEEPVHCDAIDSYRRITSSAHAHIAAGEEECTVRGHERLLREGGIDIVQIDLTRCGFTQSIKIASIAARLGRNCVNHNFTTDLNTAASLHFLAAIENAFILERCFEPSELTRRLVRNPIPMADGFLSVPDEPGLGVEPDLDVVAEYAVAA